MGITPPLSLAVLANPPVGLLPSQGAVSRRMSGKLRNQSARPSFSGSQGPFAADTSLAIFPAPARITGPCVILAKRDCFPTANAPLICVGDPVDFILARASELPGSGGGIGRRPSFAGSPGSTLLLLHTGASHRVLRHPREARLTPQAQVFGCELIQRQGRRAT